MRAADKSFFSSSSKPRIGFLGDGQLARFLALRGHTLALDMSAVSLDPTHSPLRGLVRLFPIHDYLAGSLRVFFENNDIIILENEFAQSSELQELVKIYPHVQTIPDLASYAAVDNKWKQKQLMESLGIPVPRYQLIEHEKELASLTYPVFGKFIRGGYDGKGNILLRDVESARAALRTGGAFLAEEVLELKKECAILVARHAGTGQILEWPVVDTWQENSVCQYVMLPSELPPKQQAQITQYAAKTLSHLDAHGLFAFEFFITQDDRVLFNEIAPRPHNTGHWTLEACQLSQYDACLYLALGIQLPSPTSFFPAIGMLNLFGTQSGPAHLKSSLKDFAQSSPDLRSYLHLYGKLQSKPGRKMGHVTLVGHNKQHILKKILEWKGQYEL